MKKFILTASLLLTFATAQAENFETKAKQAYLVDFQTGDVLYTKDADTKMYPSSMSKLMTIYIVFDRLKQGKLTLDTPLQVSEKAWRMQGSKMFVPVGQQIAVKDLIQGVIVQSGNDACIVLAEGIAGTEEAFAAEMNYTAKKLGLEHSHFMNSTGWPDEQHYMSAQDLATLSKYLIQDFPEYYVYFSEQSFTYHGITQPNRNGLLSRNLGVDGLKTGHTEIAGYGIAISAIRDGRRLVGVVNGLKSENERLSEAQNLLEYGYRSTRNVTLFNETDVLDQVPVWFGDKQTVGATLQRKVFMTLPYRPGNLLEGATAKLKINSPAPAPIQRGQTLGELTVTTPDGLAHTYPLYAAEDVSPLGFWGRIGRNINRILGRD